MRIPRLVVFLVALILIIITVSLGKKYSAKREFRIQETIWLSPVNDEGSVPTAGVKFERNNTGAMFLITDAPVLSDLDGWPKRFNYITKDEKVEIYFSYKANSRSVERKLTLYLFKVEGRQYLIDSSNLNKKDPRGMFGGFRCLGLSEVEDQHWEPTSYEKLKEVARKSVTKKKFLSDWEKFKGMNR